MESSQYQYKKSPPLPPKEKSKQDNIEEIIMVENNIEENTITKKIDLTKGNLVINCPVPIRELFAGVVPYVDGQEFTSLRYTACTSDPDDFKKEGFTLRQSPKSTKLFIAITMYNENEIQLANTLYGITKNINYICNKKDRQDAWKEVVVCIIADGRKKVSQRVLAYLAVLGIYQDGIMQTNVNNKDVNSHIFEYTTQIAINPVMKMKTANIDEGIVPVQLIFCLKEENKKKINSHRWFFNAFGSVLEPEICVLVDVGTKPGDRSIYELWEEFKKDPKVAGVCGEIVASIDKGCKGCFKFLNPIVGAQNFEYKMSNILDKPFESVFGYVTVLPGAFSAYRYIALQNTITGEGQREEGPLASYFQFEKDDLNTPVESIITANMYLAEDRILCFELFTKRNDGWLLRYIKSSQAKTDIPEDLPELISQRRRWLNGSFFASFYAITHFYYVFRSGHSIFRKFIFCVEILYQALNLLFSWFALGNLYLTFFILGSSFQSQAGNKCSSETSTNKAIFVKEQGGIKAKVTISDENTIKRAHKEAWDELNRRERKVKRKSPKEKLEDSQKFFRTLVLILWIFTNSILIIFIKTNLLDLIINEQIQSQRYDSYVIFIFWSVTGLTVFRFLGSFTYVFSRLFSMLLCGCFCCSN
ncbi:3107_t:CDS:2 [Scutellospora calospora]|uniref:3107_t:CDS:1 n=1 Tax=Scutellospora calospora TaxID=85575 RepID=A0ACA9K9B6_9GLOM|nr:3107_t:CDS:2 [Scutellospora calospora]